ncbi:MAG: type I-U CRISPR-associated protein Csb2 [Verrucomicrobiota bacterium]|nr:type I-U CRISPR-associated protein Csb2 [Verrucomicrobiota bacterium]
MQNYLCVTIRFLDDSFHGRADGGEPEWPPSPLRLYQALVAAAAARWNEREKLGYAVPALRWLEQQCSPMIIAPSCAKGARYRIYVPDNVGDLVGRSWSKRGAASFSEYRTEKDVEPMRLADANDEVHYCWPVVVDADSEAALTTILTAARSITHLGWGIDMVVADAEIRPIDSLVKFRGLRWEPGPYDSGTVLRVPTRGTLDNLIQRHTAFLKRTSLSESLFQPVPALATFSTSGYHLSTTPTNRPFVAFSLRQTDDHGFSAFDTARHSMTVAAMVRHASSSPKLIHSLGWPEEDVSRIILGHAEDRGAPHQPVAGPRLAFIPVPSIESRNKTSNDKVVGSVRRVLVVPFGSGLKSGYLSDLARLLDGQDLIEKKSPKTVAVLSRIQSIATDRVLGRYLEPSSTWATVTPVVLPGYDDPRKLRRRLSPEGLSELDTEEKKIILKKLDQRIDYLLRKAIVQSGFSPELSRNAEIDWRGAGYWPGTESASRYAVPEQHRRYRRLHVRITWRDANHAPISIPGPICIGGGKYSGMGLFASLPVGVPPVGVPASAGSNPHSTTNKENHPTR